MLDENGIDIFEVEYTEIPASFWSLRGIDFDANAASNGTVHYCHISCSTTEMVSLFPGERTPVNGVMRVGNSFVLDERIKLDHVKGPRGRPSYPWEKFYVEVTALITRDELPSKKKQPLRIFKHGFSKNWAYVQAGLPLEISLSRITKDS